jgi:hypothetical protein
MSRRKFFVAALVAVLSVLALGPSIARASHGPECPQPAVFTPADPLVLTPFSTVTSPIGIGHHAKFHKLIVSGNYPTGLPNAFFQVGESGAFAPYSPAFGFVEEIKLDVVEASTGGFKIGQTYSGTGVPGEVAKISADGTTVTRPWSLLPLETGLLRGGLFHDRYNVVDGDLIVVTTNGGVWRVNSAGVPTKIAQLTRLEGVTTVPDNAPKYGPFAGKIVAGAEPLDGVYTIDPATGEVDFCDLNIVPENIDVIREEDFYGVNFPIQILFAGKEQFQKHGLLVLQESPGATFEVRWNNHTDMIEVTPRGTVSQWEMGTFAQNLED